MAVSWTRLLASTICVLAIASCTERSDEEMRRDANAHLAPEAELAADESVTVRWPSLTTSSGELIAKEVSLRVPAQYAPEPAREWPHSAKPRIESIAFTVVLSNIKPLPEPPPIHPEVYDGPRLYSMPNVLFGKKPDSMANPKTRAEFEAWREWRRIQKRVRIQRNKSFGTMEQRHREVNFMRSLYDSPLEVGTEGYLLDGETGGLHRYSKFYCLSAHEQSDPKRNGGLKNKQADDPSPSGCAVNRDLALYVSPSEGKEWVFIKCDSLGTCTAKFQAGLRGVEVDMWAFDVVRWRETVTPVRQLIDSFVISDPGAEPVMSNRVGNGF